MRFTKLAIFVGAFSQALFVQSQNFTIREKVSIEVDPSKRGAYVAIETSVYNEKLRFNCEKGTDENHYVSTIYVGESRLNANFIIRPRDNYPFQLVGSIVDEGLGLIMQISPNGRGYPMITVTPVNQFPNDEGNDGIKPNLPQRRLNERDNRRLFHLQPDDQGYMDIMVVWTKEAECKQSSMSSGCTVTSATQLNMRDLVLLAVAETNYAYSQSGVNAQLRLVHSYRHPTYVESSLGTTLNHLHNPSDGVIDEIHTKRETYGADIVALIVGNPGCGIAKIGPSFKNMFSVTKYSCATGYYTFGHEIGHNLGCHHDRGAKGECGSKNKFHYGWRDPDADFRSILAYNCVSGECDNNPGGGCTRVQRFSNPFYKYNGKYIGNKKNDNARQINDVRPEVSEYFPTNPPGPSCMSGHTEVFKYGKYPAAVRDLQVGDRILGMNAMLEKDMCTVEAVGEWGFGELYGNYTEDHYILTDGEVIKPHGNNGDITVEIKYELLTSCPFAIDRSGINFTPVDGDLISPRAEDGSIAEDGYMSLKDYVILHSAILRVIKKTGPFFFSLFSYKDSAMLGMAPEVGAGMLACARDNDCANIEVLAPKFIDTLLDEYKEKVLSAFPGIGRADHPDSVSNTIRSEGNKIFCESDRECDDGNVCTVDRCNTASKPPTCLYYRKTQGCKPTTVPTCLLKNKRCNAKMKCCAGLICKRKTSGKKKKCL